MDPLSGTDGAENRIATLFVYLNDCESGGATRFLSLPSQRSLVYEVGEKVCCKSTGRDIDGEGDYPGVITAVHADGQHVDVAFDDGDALEKVPRDAVRAVCLCRAQTLDYYRCTRDLLLTRACAPMSGQYETMAIRPAEGLGVLFFPAYLPTSPKAAKFHKQLDRYTVHEGSTAVDEKWVHQTWVWPGHPQAYFDGVETSGPSL